MSDLFSKIKQIEDSFKADKKEALKTTDFESLKNIYLGRKGKIASLFKDLSQIPDEKKKRSWSKNQQS